MKAPLAFPSGINDVVDKKVTERLSKLDASGYGPNGHWLFEEQMYGEGKIGFIYGIRNLVNGKLYLGKKQYYGTGVKNKGVESTWQTYYSSNKIIDEDIRALRLEGKDYRDYYDFYCIEEYTTKGGFSFAEVWTLVTAEIPCNRTVFLNKLINGVSWPVKERVTTRHKKRLLSFIMKAY